MIPGRELPVLRAITLYRPWSDAIVDGHKPVENRGWPPPLRFVGGYLAIHGGLRYDDHLEWPAGWTPPEYNGIGIVGVVRVAGYLDTRDRRRRVVEPQIGPPLTADERAKLEALDRDPWWAGPVGWLCTEAVRIETVDVKGARGLWEVPTVAANQVRKQWLAARGERAGGT